MSVSMVKIKWPNGRCSIAQVGADWLRVSKEVGIEIPTGCLGGSCGACEIEVNGEVIRACISLVPDEKELNVDFFSDPFW